VVVIALLVDFLLARLGRVLMPWAPRRARARRALPMSASTIPAGEA
jgi:hypothetical protein